LHEARMIRETSIAEGRTEAHKVVLRQNSSKLAEGQPAMTVDEMEELKRDLTYTYAAQSYFNQATTWFDSALEENKKESSELNSDEVENKLKELKAKTSTEEAPKKASEQSRRE
jgi:hypothetical protein